MHEVNEDNGIKESSQLIVISLSARDLLSFLFKFLLCSVHNIAHLDLYNRILFMPKSLFPFFEINEINPSKSFRNIFWCSNGQ